MKSKKIVTIGGGTGSFTLLSGLKNYKYDITAIVTMADDGGSTGKLRDELGVLPPGDVRQCLVALSESSEELRSLMSYRFDNGGLEGHSFGNLFLSALEKINNNFSEGVEKAIKILNVKGNVVPVSEDEMRLEIELNDGNLLRGEKELDDSKMIQNIGIKNIRLTRRVRVNRKAKEAIMDADFVIIGPGDYYGSIMPNLLVRGIKQAIKKTNAKIIFVAPLTNKRGQTGNYKVHDYVEGIEKQIGKNRFDFVIYNKKKQNKNILAKYEKKEGKNSLVVCDYDIERKYRIIEGNLLKKEKVKHEKGDKLAHTRAFIRHDSNKLARAITLITEYSEYRTFNIK